MGAEIVASNHWARWYAAEDTWAPKPRFAWTRLDPSQPKPQSSLIGQASQGLPMDQVSRFNAFSMPTAESLALQCAATGDRFAP